MKPHSYSYSHSSSSSVLCALWQFTKLFLYVVCGGLLALLVLSCTWLFDHSQSGEVSDA